MFITDNGFHIFLCEAKDNIDLNYSKKYEVDKILFLPINKIKNYRYSYQVATKT